MVGFFVNSTIDLVIVALTQLRETIWFLVDLFAFIETIHLVHSESLHVLGDRLLDSVVAPRRFVWFLDALVEQF